MNVGLEIGQRSFYLSLSLMEIFNFMVAIAAMLPFRCPHRKMYT